MLLYVLLFVYGLVGGVGLATLFCFDILFCFLGLGGFGSSISVLRNNLKLGW